MGVKTKITVPAKRKAPVKRPAKTTVKRVSNVKKPAGRMDKIDAAILAMTDRMAVSTAKTDAAILSMTNQVAKVIEAMKQEQEETNQALRRTTEEMHKTTRELSEKLQKTTEEMHKTTRELSENLQKTTEEMHKTTRDLSESIHDIDGNVGGVNRRLGKIVELVVLPGLMEKMNSEFSHRFDNVAPNKKFTADGQMYAEMDLFLENGDSVMAVEAKTRLTLGMVNAFVQKLETLRQHEVKAGLVGKKIYAAIAGIIFDDNARKIALEKGIYLIAIDQNNDRIKIEPPTRPAGKW